MLFKLKINFILTEYKMYPPEQAYVLFYAHSGVSIQHVLCKIPQILIKKRKKKKKEKWTENWVKSVLFVYLYVDKHACKYVLHVLCLHNYIWNS